MIEPYVFNGFGAELVLQAYGSPWLRKATRHVALSWDIQGVVQALTEATRVLPCVGLAVNQLALDYRICTLKEPEGQILVFVNPCVVLGSAESLRTVPECCLSLPGFPPVPVVRARQLVVEYSTPSDVKERRQAVLIDQQAQALQHELDHLEGKLLVDYAASLESTYERRLWQPRIKKLTRVTKASHHVVLYHLEPNPLKQSSELVVQQ